MYIKGIINIYLYIKIKTLVMKNAILLLTILLVSAMTYAQNEKKLGLNEETKLIEATYFHENGKVSQKGTFNLDGKLHGEWISFSEEGKKISKGSYVNGRKVGKWIFWLGDDMKEVRYNTDGIASVDGIKKAVLVKN